MKARALVALVAIVVATGLAACDPPAGSGLKVTAQSATTGLQPGSVVQLRVAGVKPRATVTVQQCGTIAPCLGEGNRTVTADANGVATVKWTVLATGDDRPSDWIWAGRRTQGCRPPVTCQITVFSERTVDGYPADAQVVPISMTGRQVQFTATPTTGLRQGSKVTVRGTVGGAGGRQVRIARAVRVNPRNEASITKVGSSVYVTVKADGTFSGTYTMPPDPNCGSGTEFSDCVLTAWVVKADGSAMDHSFGMPVVDLAFA